ncbi:MAG TPA: helix-turn-helix domain-containing protein [Nonomuraea sp.]|nr:helix-turn-helix domain-containing protein [Nonomuraea sp.]
MLRIHFGREDLVATRVARAADPLWEILLSLHVLQSGPRQANFDGWPARAHAGIARQGFAPQLRHLTRLFPVASYNPDFLTPVTHATDVDDAVETVLSTPARRLRHDLAALAEVVELPAWAERLARAEPDAARNLGTWLRGYFRLALEPIWDHVRAQVDADRMVRGQALLAGGTEHLLATLGPPMRWKPPVLEVDYRCDRDLHLNGRGLLLVPAYFCRHRPIGIADPELPPVLAYPVFPSAVQHPGHHRRLEPLLGDTRTAILRATQQSRSTGELARMLNISAATVSYHTAVLRDAGLLASEREAKRVLHTATSLGVALLVGATPNVADRETPPPCAETDLKRPAGELGAALPRPCEGLGDGQGTDSGSHGG